MSADDYLIWWLADRDALEPSLPGVPAYIREQYRDRVGRSGRGRLWCPPDIPVKCMTQPSKAPIVCGGIVIHAKDVQFLHGLAGFVTDLSGERISTEEVHK